MSDPSALRRRFSRVPANISVLVRGVGDGTLGRLGRVKTIGVGGCLVVMDRAFSIGDLLKLRLIIGGQALETTSRVVYCIEKEPGEFHAGTEFLDMGPSAWAGIQKSLGLGSNSDADGATPRQRQ